MMVSNKQDLARISQYSTKDFTDSGFAARDQEKIEKLASSIEDQSPLFLNDRFLQQRVDRALREFIRQLRSLR